MSWQTVLIFWLVLQFPVGMGKAKRLSFDGGQHPPVERAGLTDTPPAVQAGANNLAVLS